MTLLELLDMQRELQTHSDKQPETLEQIHLAQMAELGEIVQAVKWGQEPVSKYPAWAWWHRDTKTPAKRADVADEIADLLCFVLLEGLFLEQQGELDLDPDRDLWDDAWQYMWDEPFWYATTMFFNDDDGLGSLHYVIAISQSLGFARDEIEAAYKAAYDKNVARWKHAD